MKGRTNSSLCCAEVTNPHHPQRAMRTLSTFFFCSFFLLLVVGAQARARNKVWSLQNLCCMGYLFNLHTQKEYICHVASGDLTFKKSQLKRTIRRAPSQMQRPAYPHTFNNHEGFTWANSNCRKQPLLEFPVFVNGYFHNAHGNHQTPGAVRVVYTSGYHLCGVIIHTGNSGGFQACSLWRPVGVQFILL